MTPARSALAADIARHLYLAGDWVSTAEICTRYHLCQRTLRGTGRTPGLLVQFALSDGAGYKHLAHCTLADHIRARNRIRRHAISELRRYRDMVRAWRAHHTTRPVLMERHTGQTLLPV